VSPVPAKRRHDLDWLRIAAVFVLFPFHVGKVFDVAPFYHVKNGELSSRLGFLTGFIHQWHMPLFFLLAGWAVYPSLVGRGPRAFLGERVARLLVPLGFGIFVLCVPLRWAELLTGQYTTVSGRILPARPDVGFLEYLPHYYLDGGLTWAHLWFLIYLFTFSLLYLPILVSLARGGARLQVVPTLVVYLPILPLAFVQVTLRERWPGFQNLVDDWANFSYYSLFFLLGFALAREPALEDAAHREWRRAALVALTALLVMALMESGVIGRSAAVSRALSAVAGWCSVVTFLGFAARHLAFSNPALDYLGTAAMPIYVLHQLAIVLLALVVIRLSAGIGVKFVLLLFGSVAATLGFYHFVVRPLPSLGFVLGVKRRR
jgi:peptidoglycan/LPS O-acetylase OafA/YrhL